MLVECLFSAVLLMTPSTEGLEHYLPDMWLIDRQLLGGLCSTVRGPNEADFVIDDNRLLTVNYNQMTYVIPLPPLSLTQRRPKTFRLMYVLGEQYAYFGDTYKVMVRMGPKGWQ